MADNNNVPTLSILVATFNCIDNFIGLCENLNSQDCQRFELLVADGSSSADISRLLRRSYIPQLGWFKSAPDDGIYNGLNQLIPHVRGSYTLVMGCDDRFVMLIV
jgi:glycosyltransferase involved in cell wall biosynthesis